MQRWLYEDHSAFRSPRRSKKVCALRYDKINVEPFSSTKCPLLLADRYQW